MTYNEFVKWLFDKARTSKIESSLKHFCYFDGYSNAFRDACYNLNGHNMSFCDFTKWLVKEKSRTPRTQTQEGYLSAIKDIIYMKGKVTWQLK